MKHLFKAPTYKGKKIFDLDTVRGRSHFFIFAAIMVMGIIKLVSVIFAVSFFMALWYIVTALSFLAVGGLILFIVIGFPIAILLDWLQRGEVDL